MNIEPCMWCGNKELSFYSNAVMAPTYWVHCVNCGASGPEKRTSDKAANAWNEIARIVREARDPKAIYLDGEELRRRGVTPDVLKEYMEQLTLDLKEKGNA